MDNLLGVIGLVGPGSLAVALIVIALLSQRLGAVTKRSPLYRWFFVGIVFVAISVVARFATLHMPAEQDNTTALIGDLAFAAGLTLAVVIAWRYWGWLLNERGKDTRGSGH